MLDGFMKFRKYFKFKILFGRGLRLELCVHSIYSILSQFLTWSALNQPELIRTAICVRTPQNRVDSNQHTLIPTPLESRIESSW